MKAAGKTNYQVSLIPGVGHGFSAPRPPRSHPYLDMTVGPVSSEFQSELSRLAEKIK